MGITSKPKDNVLPISRSLVLQHLRDPNEEAQDADVQVLGPTASETELEASSDYSNCDNNLQNVTEWLNAQCQIEQARIDWTLDFSANHGDGPNYLTNTKPAMDTTVLHRIRKDKGPHRKTFGDLIAPLRLAGQTGSWPSTYQELLEVILTWNKYAAGCPVADDEVSREALVAAVCTRVSVLNTDMCKRRSADALEHSSRKVLQAIHMYRPETATFQTKDPYALLITVLAHVEVARPDIDGELKFLLFFVLINERKYVAWISNEAQRRDFERRLAEAQIKNDKESVTNLNRKEKDWAKDIFTASASTVIDDIKAARRQVYQKHLDQLLNITVLQAAQKSILEEKLSKALDRVPENVDSDIKYKCLMHLLNSCATATSQLDLAISNNMPDLNIQTQSTSQTIETMTKTTRDRVITRAVKISGRDLKARSSEDRAYIVRQRMAMPATAIMMADAVAGMQETKTAAGTLAKELEDIEGELKEIHITAEHVQSACIELMKFKEKNEAIHNLE